jgi:hypothetical protein
LISALLRPAVEAAAERQAPDYSPDLEGMALRARWVYRRVSKIFLG